MNGREKGETVEEEDLELSLGWDEETGIQRSSCHFVCTHLPSWEVSVCQCGNKNSLEYIQTLYLRGEKSGPLTEIYSAYILPIEHAPQEINKASQCAKLETICKPHIFFRPMEAWGQ